MQRISITNPQNIIDGTAKKYYFKLRNTGGPKGDKGEKGDTGATGPQGPQGNAATVSVGSTTTLPVGYDATVTNTGSIYNAVLDFGIPQGPQGPQGAKGDKGDTGAKGDTGPRGPQGERGTNATVYIGTTTTLNPGSQATVYNSGTDSNAVLNFGIPRGEKGETGATGATGATGPAGQDGQNFTPTIVAELPSTGDESKLYLTPKAHTTQTATGNPVTASVTEQAGKIESFQLDGDTYQQGYTGQNLYNVATLQTSTHVTKDDDGWITITRDNTSGSSATYTNAWTSNLALETNTQYAIFLEIKEASGTGEFDITSTNSTQGQFTSWQSKQIADLAAGQVYKVTPTTKSSFSGIFGGLRTLLNLSAGQSASITFRLSVLADTSVTPSSFVYEPYVGGQASPNPDYPQAIQTVTGEQTVTITGKNLFNKNEPLSDYYLDANGVMVYGAPKSYINQEFSVIPSSTFAFSYSSRTGSAYIRFAEFDANGVFTKRTLVQNKNATITLRSDTAKVLWSVDAAANIEHFNDLQIEISNSASSYAPYHATSYPISLGSIELCKIGDYQDYIYKDGDDWKIHKATSKYTFTGDEQWSSGGVGNHCCYATSITDYATSNNVPYSPYFGGVSNVNGAGTMGGKPDNSIAFIDQSATVRFYIRTTKFENDAPALKTWLSTHNTKVYYALATATDTTITDQTLIAQLEAVRTASLENGANTITNTATGSNLAGDMEISYYGYNPTNRYDKFIWLDLNNAYEQLNNPDTSSTLSTLSTLSTRTLGTTTEQPTVTRSLETETITLKKGETEPIEDKTELPTILDEEAEETETTEPEESDGTDER